MFHTRTRAETSDAHQAPICRPRGDRDAGACLVERPGVMASTLAPADWSDARVEAWLDWADALTTDLPDDAVALDKDQCWLDGAADRWAHRLAAWGRVRPVQDRRRRRDVRGRTVGDPAAELAAPGADWMDGSAPARRPSRRPRRPPSFPRTNPARRGAWPIWTSVGAAKDWPPAPPRPCPTPCEESLTPWTAARARARPAPILAATRPWRAPPRSPAAAARATPT